MASDRVFSCLLVRLPVGVFKAHNKTCVSPRIADCVVCGERSFYRTHYTPLHKYLQLLLPVLTEEGLRGGEGRGMQSFCQNLTSPVSIGNN